jgi:hypothetical protein
MKEDDKVHKEVELRSEELHEVMGKIPPWILRWGITVLLCIIIVLFTGSFFFKYPDVITAPVVLTGSIPPANIIAFSSGNLNILINDNQDIKAGDYLGVIYNSARTEDILYLKEYLSHLDVEQDSTISMPEKNLQVGNLQSQYSSFYATLFSYNEYMRLQYYPQKIEMTKERIVLYEKQYQSLLHQQKIVYEQNALTDNSHTRSIELYEKGGISGKEMDESKSRQLQSQLSEENMLNQINNMQIQMTQLKESLMDMEYQHTEKTKDFRSQLRSMILQIKSDIQSWEMNYVLISPIDGKITFTRYWVSNQNVRAGEDIFTVIPTSEFQIIGKASLPIARSGKVKIGQSVNIRLDNFPDNEFGMLKGVVNNVSLVPATAGESNYYVVEIELPHVLKTNYGKDLPHLSNMQGTADIITENISLLERFIMPIKKIFKEGYD